MPIQQTIKQQLDAARRNRKRRDVSILSFILSEIATVGKDKRQGDATDQEAINVIQKVLKSNKQTLLATRDQIRQEALKYEITVLTSFLPKQLTEDEIKAILVDFPQTPIGQIMSHFHKYYNGQYDRALLAKLAKGE